MTTTTNLDGLSWRGRLESLLASLRANPDITVIDAEIGAQATDDEIEAAVAALGFRPADGFLAYFRSANGCRISWVNRGGASREQAIEAWRDYRTNGGTHGAISIPTLQELCARPRPGFGSGDASYHVPILGGWRDDELRAALRVFDRHDYLLQLDETPSRSVVLVLHPRLPDPVVLMSEDYGASLADRWAMRARGYLELMAVTGGDPGRDAWFKAMGFAGDHPVIEIERAELGDVFEGCADWDILFQRDAKLLALKRRVGLLPPAAEPPRPVFRNTVWKSASSLSRDAVTAAIEGLGLHEKVVPGPPFVTFLMRPAGSVTLIGDPIDEVEVILTEDLYPRLIPILEAHGLEQRGG